ncbi:MAG: hypothetical protein ACPLRA_03185 [Candidatus Saccharicenans sp.]
MKPATRRISLFLALVISVGTLLASFSFYLGFWHYGRYQEVTRNIKSLEEDFPRLEARLRKAILFYPLSLFQAELGKLRRQRAMAEIEFGIPEKSEDYLDNSRASLREAIAGNPVDYSFFWELTKVYFLYNYPLLTYADKGRLFCQEAVRRAPFNEFLVLNVLVVFFEQWPLLEPSEKDWLKENIKRIQPVNPGFLDRLKNKWWQNHKETQSLELRLGELGI